MASNFKNGASSKSINSNNANSSRDNASSSSTSPTLVLEPAANRPSRTQMLGDKNPFNIITYLQAHNYRLGEVIGKGSYSKVRITTRCKTDGSPSHNLACKIINKRSAGEYYVEKFLPRELDVISKIQHPNIIPVYDMVEFDDNVYIFMDWCDKGDLLAYIDSNGPIPEPKGRYYFRQLLSAVHYLHNLDLSHRDLKCENILMKKQKDQIFVADFGFARSCCDGTGKRILSSTYCGSAAYASPEVLLAKPYDPKLYDVWSLGCILFIMLTENMPYGDGVESSIPKMLKLQMKSILYYPEPSNHRVTPLAKACISRMLEADVTRRANIEQICSHDWVTTTDLPSPAICNQRPKTSPPILINRKSTEATSPKGINNISCCDIPKANTRGSACGDEYTPFKMSPQYYADLTSEKQTEPTINGGKHNGGGDGQEEISSTIRDMQYSFQQLSTSTSRKQYAPQTARANGGSKQSNLSKLIYSARDSSEPKTSGQKLHGHHDGDYATGRDETKTMFSSTKYNSDSPKCSSSTFYPTTSYNINTESIIFIGERSSHAGGRSGTANPQESQPVSGSSPVSTTASDSTTQRRLKHRHYQPRAQQQ